MKSDSSRITFDPRKHFSSVRMQQGRVQIDADSNEQIDIVNHRVKAEASDVIGVCGAPMNRSGFHIVKALDQLSKKEQALAGNKPPPDGLAMIPAPFTDSDFLISAGRYYVDGILCENEQLISYLNQSTQADLPNPSPLVKGLYLVYLDVWQRLLTALDDPSIREIALGGPDTATRAKTVWQVKCWPVVDDNGQAKGNCLTKFDAFEKLIAPSDGKLACRTQPERPSTDACIVSPGAGYTGPENQLYRVEIHDGGPALDVKAGGATATRLPTKNQIRVSGAFKTGQAIEFFSSKVGANPMKGTLAYIIKAESTAKPTVRRVALTGPQILTLDIDVTDLELNIRAATATFKWSRDNGVVVTPITSIDSTNQKVTVLNLGPDDTLGFKEGQWVELSDDGLELNGLPGQLAQITGVDSALSVITLNVVPSLVINPKGPDLHPKLRRWDGIGAVKYDSTAADEHFLDLETGVQVRFFPGQFKTSDYWTVPARTATADTQLGRIEWPQDANKDPLPQLPFGIKHHYCRLAMLNWDGGKNLSVQDCRHLFPPITELTSLFYVSGDGQEVMPILAQRATPLPLPQPLIVGVANGEAPVQNAEVRFQIDATKGNGQIQPAAGSFSQPDPKTLDVLTDENGLARCSWQVDSTTQSQQLKATLQAFADLTDPTDHPVHLPVIFTANLSVADQVFYDPGECGTLQEQGTVQRALTRLSELRSLYKISGDGQEIMPGDTVGPLPLKVLVASPCGPVTDDKFLVTFRIVDPEKGASGGVVSADGGESGKSSSGVRGNDGFWTCSWQPDPKMPFQEVEASIQSDRRSRSTITAPTTVRFSLNLSTADHVAYTPGDCNLLKGSDTVQKAIDQLSRLNSLYTISGDGQEIMPGETVAPLIVLVASPCGASEKVKVTFAAVTGGGKVDKVTRGENGIWICNWSPDEKTPFQEVEASLTGDATTPPTTVRFSLNLSTADHVAYSPGECGTLTGSNTVQKAIDRLSQLVSLYEVSGNNLEVIRDQKVELKVLAANRCGPVKDQTISFKLISGEGNIEPATFVTKEDGIAITTWTIDPKNPNQQVEATFGEARRGSIAPPSSVIFNAHLSLAANVVYDPTACPDLVKANVTTVQGALDQLCKGSKPQDEPGIHIKEIRTGSLPLLNDTLVPVSRLADGVTIVCDKPLAPSIADGNLPQSSFPIVAPKPTCFVTLDMPSPFDIFGNSIGNGLGTFGFHPLILASNVAFVTDTAIPKDTAIRWFLTPASNEWLKSIFKQGSALNKVTDRVLAHLTLKGNFIVSSGPEPEMWLDGEAFAIRNSKPTDPLGLHLGGDGRRGGDFEMWFWLVQG